MTWFCIAREGGTIDGRKITAEMLSTAAKNYDPKIYGARINKEHMRGVFLEDQFGAFGDVLSLKTEKDEGGKVCLYATLDPTPELIELNKKRQKVYTSIELSQLEEFEGFYLSGLAVTDSPASTGTSMLKFNAQKDVTFSASIPDESGVMQTVNFKTAKGALSDYIETELNFSAPSEDGESFFKKIKSLLHSNKQNNDADIKDLREAVTAVAEFQSSLDKRINEKGATVTTEQYQTLKDDFDALKTQLEAMPSFTHTPRPTQTGPAENLTDC